MVIEERTTHQPLQGFIGVNGFFQPLRKANIHFQPTPRDVLVQCQKCKTVETLQFVQGKLLPCSKFSQVEGKIYHACNSTIPCSLYK
jgi:hypothetical protein